MENNKDNWERITNFTEEYQPEPDLASEAILKLNQKESTVKFKKVIPLGISILICFILVVTFLLVSLLNKNDSKIYLYEDELRIVKIEDIDKFIEDKDLDVIYNNFPNCSSQSIEVKTNDKVAYIEQIFYFIGSESFEQVNFKIVLIDAIYSFSESFTILDRTLQISNFDIRYNVVNADDNNNLYARFTYNNIDYYLEIKDVKDTESTLNGVINLLKNK